MAGENEIGRVSFGVEAQFGDVHAQFASLHKQLDAVAGKVNEASTASSRSFADWGKSVSESGRAIGASMFATGLNITKIAAPLVGMGALAAKTAIDFESSFAGVRKTIDATEAEFSVLEHAFRDLSKQIPVSVNELNKIGEISGQLGIAKGDVLEFTKTVAAMGATTNLSSEAAANAFARIGNIMGVTSQEFSKLGSTIVDLGNKGASTESEIVAMALRIAGAANAAKFTTPALLGLSAALANVGIKAESGGTSMSKLIIKISEAVAAGGEDLDSFAKVAGLSAEKFGQAFRDDGANAIALFVQGLGKLHASGGNLFGTLDELGIKEIRLRDAMLRAAGASEQFTQTLVTARTAWAENTALTVESEKRYKTVASQLAILQNKFADVSLTLGQALLPFLVKVLQSLDPLVNLIAKAATAFAGLDPRLQGVIAGTVAFAAVIGPALLILGSLVTAVSGLIPVIVSLGGALAGVPALLATVGTGFTALSAVLLANPWILVVAAIAAAVIAIYANWDKIKKGAQESWDATKKIVVGTAKAIYEGIVEWLINKTGAVAAKLQSVAESFAKPFEWLSKHLVGKSVVPDMVEDIGRHMEQLDFRMGSPARIASTTTLNVFRNMQFGVAQIMGQVVSVIISTWGQVTNTISQALAQSIVSGNNWRDTWKAIYTSVLASFINLGLQLATQGAVMAAREIGTASATAASVGAINAAKYSAIIAGETATATASVSIWAGASAAIVGFFGSVAAGFAAISASLVAIVTAVGTFIMGVLSAIASALSATVFGVPYAGAILVGIALIAAALAATGNLGFKEGGIGDFGSGTPATLHGKEAVIPLNDRGADFMRDMMGMGTEKGGQRATTITVPVYLDGREIARAVARHTPAAWRTMGAQA